MVLLGTPTPDSSRLYALTVTQGDPSWAGPLAGVALGLPVYHILEPEIKAQIPPEVYEQHLAVPEMVLETQAIVEAVKSVREESEGSER